MPQQSPQESFARLLFPNDNSDASKLQDAPPPYPASPSLSPSRKTSGNFKLRNATTMPNIPPSTPVIRKSSSSSTLVPLPSPLRIFKRQGRKPSFSALLSRPSVQSLKAQLFPSTVPEPVKMETEASTHSPHRLGPHQKTSIGQISSVGLLPTPPGSDNEGYETDTQSQLSIKTPRARSFSSEDEGYGTDHHSEIDLQNPTRIERRMTSINVITGDPSSPGCALCRTELKDTLETYAFPTTAPAIIARIRSFYPAIDANHRHHSSANWPTSSIVETAGNIDNHTSTSPTFCLSCFEKFHALHICWTCGFTIHRDEERVGYGWAWWHWGCMSCLLCRVPVSPPAWTAGSITLSDSPACRSCLRELRDLVFIERRRLNASRRGFSPPWRLDLGFGIECNNGNGAGVVSADGEDNEGRDVDSAIITGNGTRNRRINGFGNAVPRSGAPDGSPSITQGARNSRMSWMMRKGDGNVGGGGVGGGGSGIRHVSPSHRLAGMVYPPLPKWMEKLPGRRNASGGVRKV